MAIKDLFSKQKAQEVKLRGANQKSLDEFRQDVESGEEIRQIRIEDSLVVPDLDYASASNFVKYGSAKKYYADSIKRIYNQYPYDGSSAEKIKFKNDLTQLERYILDNEYPKSTGFAVFSPDGWGTNDGTNSAGFYSSSLPEYITSYGYKVNQVWNTTSSQQQSYRLDFTTGFTVEFWLKKGTFGVGGGSEVVFDIRDTVNASASFGAYMISTAGTSNLYSYYNNSTDNIFFTLPTGLGTSDTDWHHYAVVYSHSDTDYTASLYVDGEFATTVTSTSANVAQTGSLKLTLGALGGDFTNITPATPPGYGKLSGSLDEFRFWQEQRNAQEIGRNYFTVVNGGGNTDNSKVNDDNPLKLSCYFKFNEGKTGTASTDAVVLDYSGRLVNGAWTGYVSNSRDTASAITQAGVGTEAGDPIIYAIHPDVVTLSTNLEASGTVHDAANVGSLQNSIPMWMLDENQSQGGELENLLQIMGSYLDSLHLQITQIPKFHEAEYQDNSNVTANPHNRRLLTSLGFDIPELFIDSDVLETISNQDDKRKFEDKLNEIKNLIYKNVYNNLNYINKSKGTVKAIRNLLRCYGIDDDLFNFNVYANNVEYVLQDDSKNSSVKFDSLDLTPFADAQNSEGVIFNFSESGNSNSAPYISGSTDDYVAFTVETNTIFPKTPSTYQDSVNLTDPAIVTASVFGVREANFTDQTTVTAPDAADISVRVVKNDNTAKFQLSSSMGVLLESDRFYDVYDNSRWSLSTRIKYELEPFTDFAGAGYKLEFNGYNYQQDVLQNSFALTASLSAVDGAAFIAADKRVYAGAEKTNITGALTHRANMKLLSVLAWADYLEDDELKSHAKDVTSFGRKEPYDNTFTFSPSFDSIFIPKFDTLAMNLAFNQVTSSDSSGEFSVPDLSSGSIGLVSKYGDYSKIVGIQNTAKGKGFANSADVKDIQYLNISTQQIPENLNADNMIKILESDDDLFFLDNRPSKYFYSLEASMYDTISREMLKTFAGVLDYASMAGSVISEYQTFNKELRTAKRNFFDRVENTPSLEKYVKLYRLLDSAIESVLFNLMPASANASDRIRTVVENHLFERPGHKKFLIPGKSVSDGPKIGKCNKINGCPPPGAAPSCCNKYDISCQQANPTLPICLDEGKNSPALETDAVIEIKSSYHFDTKSNMGRYLVPLNQQTSRKIDLHLNRYANKRFTGADDSTGRNAWFAIIAQREEAGLSTPTDGDAKTRNSTFYSLKTQKIIEAGQVRVDGEYYPIALYGSQRSNQNGNIILPLIQPEELGNDLVLSKNDVVVIDEEITKNFIDFSVQIENSTTGRTSIDSDRLPIRFTLSGSGGFFTGDASVIGHRIDTYYGSDLSAPMQGPFTEQHVGGYKHRHTEIGQTADRPELYKISPTGSNQVKIFNPRQDLDGTTYDMNIPRVKFSRDGLTKRVYNTQNIKSTTGSNHLGNFQNNYEVVNTVGRRENNLAFIQQGGFGITGSESTIVSGNIDFALPNRALSDGTHNKSVIVSRFASPGEVATMAEGYLDVDAAEYSPYNALTYRNRLAVDSLNDFSKTPATNQGYQSGSATTASFHKVNPNRVNILKYNSAGSIFTSSFNDNNFVSHQIPRKDFGYRWISSSADPDLSMDGLYGFATSSNGITFYSSSLRGVGEAEIVNFLGYSTPPSKIGTAGYHYELTMDSNLLVAPTSYTDGTQPTSASIYFLNINGPYRYPSWKQTRTGEHPIAIQLREENTILAGTEAGEVRINHSPITTKYKPILHNVKSREIVGLEPADKDVLLKYTFGNNYDYFGNYYDYSGSKLDNVFRDKNFTTANKRDSLFYGVSTMYTQGNNALKLNSLLYSETIYPKETNTYLSKARDRSRFVFNWRDSLDNRINQITGSQNSTQYSYWAMDINSLLRAGELLGETSGSHASSPQVRYGRYKLSSSLAGYVNTTASSPQNTVQFGTNDSAGQGAFEDTYSEWNNDIRLIAKDHTIIPEYKISDHIAGIVSSGFDIANNTYQSLSLTGSKATSDNSDFLETYAHSDNIPAIEIVRETQEKDADKISINVSAVKKLLPYDGFYPVQRTLQLSTLFSSSVEPGTTTTGADASFQTLNNTIFSRLTYGSIRAGVATDTAIWQSGTLLTDNSTAATAATATFDVTDYTALARSSKINTARIILSASNTTSDWDDNWRTPKANNPYAILFSFDGLGQSPWGVAGSGQLGVDASTPDSPLVIDLDAQPGGGGSAVSSNAQAATRIAEWINYWGNPAQSIFSAKPVTASAASNTVTITDLLPGTSNPLVGNDHIVFINDNGYGTSNALTGSEPPFSNTALATIGFDPDAAASYDAYSASFGGGALAVTDKSFNPTASWSRLPFETIINPSAYLNSNTSLIENDPENPFDSTASVNSVGGTYELAASNFYAGVIDTFIENKTLTTIKTSPQSQWSFSDATLNNYVMDVVVSKPDGFSNHDDPAANGAPYTAHACFYQPLNYDGAEWWTKHITNGSSSVNAEIPPAASWSENEAIVTINFDYNAFKTAVTERDKPNFGDILQYSTRTFKNKQMFDQLGATDATSTSSNSSQFMTIEAGVDLFNFDSNTEQWVINTKCEFPVHNVFDEEGNALDALYPDGTDGSTGTAAGDVNRGVWHQFSPLRESKLKLGVVGPDLTNNRESGSLAQACGFETEQKTISQIASSAKLKEYLVVIPFVTNECDEETFFHYPIDEFERAYAAIPTGNPQPTVLATSAIQTRSTTLTDSLARQRELILPPTLSYMAKRDNLDKRLEQEDYGPILPPFAMYVFEVEQTLSQEDLSKWWQGVLPSAGEKATFEKFNISHDIKAGEIISPSVLNNDLFNGKLPKEMRFKIFKTKYRRNLTYNEVKNNSLYGDELVNSTIGYNYPHDFYSLIEMAKVDLGLEYKGEPPRAISITDDREETAANILSTGALQNALTLLSEDEE